MQVVPGVYLILKFIPKSGVQLKIPHSIAKDMPLANKEGDVGLTFDRVSGWSFLFPLEHFSDPRNAGYLKALKSAHLIGQISNSNGMDCIRKKTSSLKDVTFTLKSDGASSVSL